MAHVISQLQPFNEHQFRRCMKWFISKYGVLTQFHMVKLHVMADIYHVLEVGKPMIGGPIVKMEFGPVVQPAYGDVRACIKRSKRDKQCEFVVKPSGTKKYYFNVHPEDSIDTEEFSPLELKCMQRAWDEIGSMDWSQSYEYFHQPDVSFIGAAWFNAGEEGDHIDWGNIIDEYDKFYNEDHSHIKELIELG